jgi:hypothetical protein
MAADRERFAACESTVTLAARLLIRTQLVQGVRSPQDLRDLADVLGPDMTADVIRDLAGYEALRVMRNLGPAAWEGEPRTAEAARRRLLLLAAGASMLQPANDAPPPRTLRRHSAFAARRRRPDAPPE